MASTEGLARTFRIGRKKVFLPSCMVTLLAPKPNQPPTFARFKVPLKFNKFDLRDYLLHAYRTPVLGVRSHISQQPIGSKTNGRVYRPPPIKTMIVELTKPFVWPRLPTNIEPWRPRPSVRADAAEKKEKEIRKKLDKTGFMPLSDEGKQSAGRKHLRQEAKRLLKEGGWTNKRQLDARFSENGAGQES